MKNNYCSIIITALFFLNIFSAFTQTVESSNFNKEGFEFYKNKEYKSAIESFNQAIAKDSKNYIAHFNLACTYAILTTLDKTCNTNYYVKAIHTLERCLELDAKKTKYKVSNDTDFDGIRNEYEFNVLIDHLNFDNPEHVRSFITGKTYTSSAPGTTYFPIDKLTIHKDGTWIYSFHKNSGEMMDYWHGDANTKREAPKLIYGNKKGTWQLNGYLLILTDENNEQFKKYSLKQPDEIGGLYYPDPNDMSGENEVRHYWSCGKCGCQPIEGLNGI